MIITESEIYKDTRARIRMESKPFDRKLLKTLKPHKTFEDIRKDPKCLG